MKFIMKVSILAATIALCSCKIPQTDSELSALKNSVSGNMLTSTVILTEAMGKKNAMMCSYEIKKGTNDNVKVEPLNPTAYWLDSKRFADYERANANANNATAGGAVLFVAGVACAIVEPCGMAIGGVASFGAVGGLFGWAGIAAFIGGATAKVGAHAKAQTEPFIKEFETLREAARGGIELKSDKEYQKLKTILANPKHLASDTSTKCLSVSAKTLKGLISK